MAVVVDTNLAFVASGYSRQAGRDCVDACVLRLHQISRDGGLLVDDLGLILSEYTKKLGHAGRPGAGEKFVKWAFNNQATPGMVDTRKITPTRIHGWRRFEEFPEQEGLSKFDADDQKFVAVSVANAPIAPILNAVDSDWWDYREELEAAGVIVEFVCPQVFSSD